MWVRGAHRQHAIGVAGQIAHRLRQLGKKDDALFGHARVPSAAAATGQCERGCNNTRTIGEPRLRDAATAIGDPMR